MRLLTGDYPKQWPGKNFISKTGFPDPRALDGKGLQGHCIKAEPFQHQSGKRNALAKDSHCKAISTKQKRKRFDPSEQSGKGKPFSIGYF